jgi:UDP-3-O-[3-hydroxymyristoyl] glucosamine N-acyltransferase
MPTLTLDQIAALVGVVPASKPKKVLGVPAVKRVSSIDDAEPDALVFAQDESSLAAAIASKAGIILAPKSLETSSTDPRVLWVEAPKYAFAVCGKQLSTEVEIGIHRQSFVDETVRWGKRLCVDAFAVIEEGVTLGDDVTVRAGARILKGTSIGSRVVVQAGAVIGSTGFGYVRNRTTGEYILFPQQGTVVIEDDVEIGANTTIDRGALGETRIGAGTKIDNLVQIGHNCRIGRNVVIASQVGISGSCVIEDGVILAGQVGLGDHVTIGKGVILGGQGGVYPGKTVKGEGEMFAGTPAEPVRDFLKTMAKVRRLK